MRSDTEEQSYATKLDEDSFKWGILASYMAISDTHFDGAGFNSFLNMLFGTKVWFVGIPKEQDLGPRGLLTNFADISPFDNNGWLNDKLDWQKVVLRKHDSL